MDGINFQIENFGPHQMNDMLCDLKWHYILTDAHAQVECRDLLSGLENHDDVLSKWNYHFKLFYHSTRSEI